MQDGSGSSSDSSSRSSASAGAEEEDEAKAISAVIDAAELKCDGVSHFDRRGAPYHGPAPHAGYVCRRCRVPGHFIQHCPTNGDPRFDFGKATVPSPAPAAPDDDGVPADLYCKICEKVMEDAVMTSKCCFSSFCDRCIRDHIVANSKCACGAQARPDDLIPNRALRTTISNILAGSASSEKTEKQRNSEGSNAVAESQQRPAASQHSHVSSEKEKGAPSEAEHSDGSESTSNPAAHEPRKEKETTTGRAKHYDAHYGNIAPIAPACYDPAFFGGADPSMYYGYGGMPYASGYPMAPHGVDMTASYYHGEHHDGRKRTGSDNQRQQDRGFKRRCGGIRSQVALVLT